MFKRNWHIFKACPNVQGTHRLSQVNAHEKISCFFVLQAARRPAFFSDKTKTLHWQASCRAKR